MLLKYFEERANIPSRLLHVVVKLALSNTGGFRVHDNLFNDKPQSGKNRRVVLIFVTILPDGGSVQSVHAIN